MITTMTIFFFVKAHMAYNNIIGRLTLNKGEDRHLKLPLEDEVSKRRCRGSSLLASIGMGYGHSDH